ncbi:hypothetical protein M758_6G149500 [Ceratodon purpureus]|nr:hypothetical protein M758_6G149500 [Ceratodon purpureus]
MAGSKHGRSGGGSGGSGEVSPLAAQLQQAWLQTQMPKTQKRSFTAVSNTQNQPSRMAPGGDTSESSRPSALSALKSLSAIFPELANVQEEKKVMISSVFEDGEHPVPLTLTVHQKKVECLGMMFGEDAIEHTIAEARALKAKAFLHGAPERSFSSSLVEQSGGSSDFSATGPLSTSHSFSGSSHQNVPDSPDVGDILSSMCGGGYRRQPSTSQSDYENETAVEEEKTPMFAYLNDILMDENVEEKKCMFVEMSAYQAMAKELGDLISYPLPPVPVAENSSQEFQSEEDGGGVDSWIDEILSGPLPEELRDSPDAKAELGFKHAQSPAETCSHVDSGLGCSTAWTDGKDSESEVAECQRAYAYPLSSTDSGNSADALHYTLGLSPAEIVFPPDALEKGFCPQALANGSGHSLHIASKPVAPSSNGNGADVPPVDLTNLLLRCAQAVEQSDYGHANELVNELRQHSSAYGNGPQRMAHYFMEALVARMSGTGGQLYSALSNNRPSEAQMLKAQMLFCEHCPFIQVPHIFANYAIMQAFKGAQRVHIIDYGILYGVQWPCLLHQLSQREGGPPQLRITGIDRPQPGFRPSARIQDTGRRLARLAQTMGVPFEFHAIAEKWEAITPANLLLRDDEVLAVNCMFRLRHLLDESVTAASPRNLLLSRIRSLNPKIFVQGVLNAGYNAPFFMTRFREALAHYSTLFEMMETTFPPENPDRQIIDHELIGREILNVVACEGLERVERSETYRQWQARTMRAGFQQKPTHADCLAKIRVAMRAYHRDFGIGEDGNWCLLGWKERITHAMTVWEPVPDSP